jgi:hypothetical protein
MMIPRTVPKFEGARWVCIFLAALALFTLPALGQQSLYFSVKQGTETYDLTPLERAGPVQEFYDYRNDESHTGLEVEQHSILFLYRDTTTNELYLVIIHDKPGDTTGGEVEFSFAGLPPTATTVIRDDPGPDTWEWTPSDGPSPLALGADPQ